MEERGNRSEGGQWEKPWDNCNSIIDKIYSSKTGMVLDLVNLNKTWGWEVCSPHKTWSFIQLPFLPGYNKTLFSHLWPAAHPSTTVSLGRFRLFFVLCLKMPPAATHHLRSKPLPHLLNSPALRAHCCPASKPYHFLGAAGTDDHTCGDENNRNAPGWGGSVTRAPACEQTGHWLDSQ